MTTTTTPATILALDASSTMIGWVVLDGATVRQFGEIELRGRDINDRCLQAHGHIERLIELYPVDVVAIESPVARFAKAVIPQAQVSGAIRVACRLRSRHVVDVTPQDAKIALAGKGNADKDRMQQCAQAYGVRGEHASDAVGIALAAAGRVQVTR